MTLKNADFVDLLGEVFLRLLDLPIDERLSVIAKLKEYSLKNEKKADYEIRTYRWVI